MPDLIKLCTKSITILGRKRNAPMMPVCTNSAWRKHFYLHVTNAGMKDQHIPVAKPSWDESHLFKTPRATLLCTYIKRGVRR